MQRKSNLSTNDEKKNDYKLDPEVENESFSILKMRLAKEELSKEQYLELLKMLDE